MLVCANKQMHFELPQRPQNAQARPIKSCHLLALVLKNTVKGWFHSSMWLSYSCAQSQQHARPLSQLCRYGFHDVKTRVIVLVDAHFSMKPQFKQLDIPSQ